jgi:hypothetical protein
MATSVDVAPRPVDGEFAQSPFERGWFSPAELGRLTLDEIALLRAEHHDVYVESLRLLS